MKKGFGGGMQQLMKQANQMQNRMKKVQDELKEREFEGTAGGGGVTVKVNGETVITAVSIQEDVFSSGDAEMLQDLFLAAANDAIKLAKDTSQKEMEKITGGFSMPGMF
ncbi:MAG: YbaB/EbfC family nucleoid-associated protein [Bdellovibrionales bacterium]|nr:YbaB/EbfC family nucleoid-associated protein [Bdellovibrionales bacterium]